MEVCEIVLSDSSEDLDNMPSFEERVALLRNVNNDKTQRKKFSPKKSAAVHSISDSEESDSLECNVNDECFSHAYNMNKEIFFEKNMHSLNSSSNEDLPELNFSENSVDKAQDGNILKEVIKFDELPNLEDICSRSLATVLKKSERPQKKAKNDSSKEIKKEDKRQMREEKKRHKELEKALKESEKEILNSQKPTECLKNMKVVIDHNILQLADSQPVFNMLDSAKLKYSIEENFVKNSVVWYRVVNNIFIDNNQIIKEEREELTNLLVLVIPNEEFLKMIHSAAEKNKGKISGCASLTEFIVSIKNLHPEMEITCVIIGFEKFLRNLKEQDVRDLKILSKQVHKDSTDQAILEIQLQTSINFHFLDKIAEFGNLLCQLTKAVAEAPLRRQKQQQKLSVFSWYADVDSNCPVKLSKDSSSFIKLWHQQIQQFQNVGPEVAEAIVSRYPSPRLLLKAYKQCSSPKEAENLLQDIVVRRNYGPLGTQKRIGPELSYKIYLFFTSVDSFQLLKR